MFESLQKLLDRIESRLALWTVIGSMTGGGVIGVWAAAATAWLDAYGPIAWWAAGMVGAVVAASLILLFAIIRFWWIRAGAMRKWKEAVDDINPLAAEFHSCRISFADLTNPVNKILRKRIVDCEMTGPANLFFGEGTTINNTRFMNCDIVVVKMNYPIRNAIGLDRVELVGGYIWNCSLLIPPPLVEPFKAMGGNFVTLTGDAAFDEAERPEALISRRDV